MPRALVFATALALLVPGSALAKKKDKGGDGGDGRDLNFKKGTMQLGGSATFDLSSYDGSTSWWLNVNPSAGYFVTKKLEVFGALSFGLTDGATTWGIDGGGRYFFDMKPMWAYLGGQGGYGSFSVSGVKANGFDVDGIGGVIIPLGKNVGLDLGASLGMVKYEGSDKGTFVMSAGYLGVEGFFR